MTIGLCGLSIIPGHAARSGDPRADSARSAQVLMARGQVNEAIAGYGLVARGLALGAIALGVITAVRALPAAHLPIGLALVAVLAYANGANDISKSVATLVGAGVADERRALRWGAVMTVVGATLGVAAGAALTATFSTRLLADASGITGVFALAILAGAIGWLAIATRLGLPVSTTHALVGAIVATGALAFGLEGVHWPLLLTVVVLPLALSPFLGIALGALLGRLVRRANLGRQALTAFHWAASGLTAAARGLNDAPKLAGLGVLVLLGADQTLAGGLHLTLGLVVAGGMAAGSLLGGRRVLETLARRVTTMDDQSGTASNIATASLVTLAAAGGLPVSTTQVAGGSIVGIGLSTPGARLDLSVVGEVAFAWLVTAPSAGLLAALAWVLLGSS